MTFVPAGSLRDFVLHGTLPGGVYSCEVLTMSRTILALLACSIVAYAETPVTGTYHFTTPLTQQGISEATTVLKSVAAVSQVFFDAATATFTFSGPADTVNFAEWALPQIDRPAGDTATHEYTLTSGDTARVRFMRADAKPQDIAELLTILRTVADVQKIFAFNPNHAMVLRGPEWEVAFSDWIFDQLNQPAEPKPDPTPRAFTVGGPDYRGLGHQARINALANLTSARQMQELLTVLRTVDDVQKVFSHSALHTLVFRAGDTDLARTEWIIQQLDAPAGPPQKPAIFTASGADDVTRVFYLPNTTAQWVQSAMTGLRSDLKISKVFAMTSPADIVVRGTSDQVAAAMAWLTAHNALAE